MHVTCGGDPSMYACMHARMNARTHAHHVERDWLEDARAG